MDASSVIPALIFFTGVLMLTSGALLVLKFFEGDNNGHS